MTDRNIITLPPGRIISGDPTQLVQVNEYSEDPKIRKTKLNNDGTPKMEYRLIVAIPKNSNELYDGSQGEGILTKIIREARRSWPEDINNDNFSWKIKDGDGLKHDGTSYQEHCKGCYLFAIRSSWIPVLVMPDNNGGWQQIIDISQLYCGCHIKVGIAVVHNERTSNTGIYLNPEFVALVRQGEVISQNKVSISDTSAYLGVSENLSAIPYPGISQPAPVTPVAPVPMQPASGAPVAPVAPVPMQPASVTPVAPVAPVPMQPAPVTPVAPVPMQPAPVTPVAPVPMQPASGTPVAPVAPVAPVPMQPASGAPVAPVPNFTMTDIANGLTREQYHGAGWTDEMLINAKMMNAPKHESILG